ncbi:menaquinone biosynthesis decarboxylase [Planctomycetota bacterium]
MAIKDQAEWISILEEAGELARIKAPVSRDLEIAAICDRVSKSRNGGKALLFENVEGFDIPVLINAFGSERRMCLAFGVKDLDDTGRRIAELIESLEKKPAGLVDKVKTIFKLKDISEYFPRIVKSGPCKDVVITNDVDVNKFPVLKCWPGDGGRYITLPLVFTKDPVTGHRNCGMYRMQVYNEREIGMHWQVHKHGRHHARKTREQGGTRIPAAVAIGCDPATVFGAMAPLPDDVDEMILAGFLRSAGVDMVASETVAVEVPANAEIVLEGYVDLDDMRTEGPFGDHTGFYSLADKYPTFKLTCITHRRNPVYSATVVGKPPMEDCWMGLAVERMFLPVIKKQLPEIVDMHMPFSGIFHNLMVVSVNKRYPGHARKIMNAIWGLGQAMLTKCIIVVDDHINVRDYAQVVWYVLNNIDPQRDLQFMMGPIDALDHSSRAPGYGSKVGIDGTRKLAAEGFDRQWPEEIAMDAEIRQKVESKWPEYGIALED